MFRGGPFENDCFSPMDAQIRGHRLGDDNWKPENDGNWSETDRSSHQYKTYDHPLSIDHDHSHHNNSHHHHRHHHRDFR